jgi:stringent starvation protein B
MLLASDQGMTSSAKPDTDAPEGKIMQLVPDSAASADEGGPDLPEPPRPRKRPALTRVK